MRSRSAGTRSRTWPSARLAHRVAVGHSIPKDRTGLSAQRIAERRVRDYKTEQLDTRLAGLEWGTFVGPGVRTKVPGESPFVTTWTDTPGASEAMPINHVSWALAFAFCAWDGGRLPTDAEWGFAAMGGDENRAYAWADPSIDGTRAAYACQFQPNVSCPRHGIQPVGTFSPLGDGRWGHSDLTGNVEEWTLDFYVDLFVNAPACNDCAQLTPAGNTPEDLGRVAHSGSYDLPDTYVLNASRGAGLNESNFGGVRCARN